MRALRWHGRRDVRLEEVEDAPPPGPGQVRLRVEWCGICGTDLEEYTSGPLVIATEPHPLTGFAAPMIIGHEVSARVTEAGAGVELRPGTLVAVDGLLSCRGCAACRRHEPNLCERWASIGMGYPGGLAELMTVPGYMVIPARGEVSPDELALAEPFSVAVHAARRGRLALGERVLVLGGGTIGQAVLQVARAAGSGPVALVDPVGFRRQAALRLGAAAALEPGPTTAADAADALGGPPDVVFDCTGSNQTPQVAVRCARAGGRVVLVGLPTEPGLIDYLGLLLREVELIGSVGHVYDIDFATAVDLISTRRVQAAPLITHRLPLERAVEDGIAFLAGPERGEALKILIRPG